MGILYYKHFTYIYLFMYVLQEMKLNWASSPGPQPKSDTSSKCNIILLNYICKLGTDFY